MGVLRKTCAPVAALLLISAAGAIAADASTGTGFFVGASVGVARGTMDLGSQTSASVGRNLFDHSANGRMVGLQLGANWQFKNLVIGFEADHSMTRIGEISSLVFGPNGAPAVGNEISIEADVDYTQTIRGRIGRKSDLVGLDYRANIFRFGMNFHF